MSLQPSHSAIQHDLTTLVDVRITVNDPDVIERVTGPGGDEWRRIMYRHLHTEFDVLHHFAYNAIVSGVRQVNRLDGWADLPDDAATFHIESVSEFS